MLISQASEELRLKNRQRKARQNLNVYSELEHKPGEGPGLWLLSLCPHWRRCPDCGHRLNQFNLSSFLQGIPGNDGVPGKPGPPGQAVSNQTGGGALLTIYKHRARSLVGRLLALEGERVGPPFKVMRGDEGDSRGHQPFFYNTKRISKHAKILTRTP